jgi:integrase/recombinase XerC
MTSDTSRTDTRTLWGEHALALRRRGLAEGTIRQRHYLVTAWFRWLELRGIDVFDADAELVEQFLDYVKRKPSARCCATSHIHMFYAWAISKGYTSHDPTAGVVRPRMVPGLPRPIHDTDLQLALVFAQEGPAADPRMEAALLLGAVSGLRCCEIARLRWEDIRDGQARVLGKGSKERVVPLNSETLAALDRIERTSEYVLAGWQNRSAAEPGERVSARVAQHFRRAGATGSAHRLRHRAATEALRKCHDLRKVQTLLGHESVSTTAIYTKVDAGDLAAIIVDVTTPKPDGADLVKQ